MPQCVKLPPLTVVRAAENGAGPYQPPPKSETSQTLRVMGSVVELLAALLRPR